MDKSGQKKAANQALINAINDKREDDPLIGAKIGADDLLTRILDALGKKGQAVHVESLLSILGSLAGYACHMAIREALVDTGKLQENQAFTILGGSDGKKYYFGDFVNKPLVEDSISFWALIAGEAKHHGAVSFPEVRPMFAAVTGTVGGENFGVPNIPEHHKPSALPLQYVRSLWPQVVKVLNNFCESPVEKPILIGLAAQKAIAMSKDIIPPETAVLILMESAIPMSKIGPNWLL